MIFAFADELEKIAFTLNELGGTLAALPGGRSAAGEIASSVAPKGRQKPSRDAARSISLVTVPASALTAGHHLRRNPRAVLPGTIAAGLAGGALTGLGVGGVQALRGSPYKKKSKDKSKDD